MPVDSSCCQLVAPSLLVPLRLPLVLMRPPQMLRLPSLQPLGRRECAALGRLLVPSLLRVFVVALVGAPLCRPLLSPATLALLELATLLSLALASLALLGCWLHPRRWCSGPCWLHPWSWPLRRCHRLCYPGGGVAHPRRCCCRLSCVLFQRGAFFDTVRLAISTFFADLVTPLTPLASSHRKLLSKLLHTQRWHSSPCPCV